MDKYAAYDLIILDDKIHSYDHFTTAIKTVFPNHSDKAIRCICALVHKTGSSVCEHGSIERLELAKENLEKFNINCLIERRTI